MRMFISFYFSSFAAKALERGVCVCVGGGGRIGDNAILEAMALTVDRNM